MKTHINVIIEFLAAQMDDAQVPPAGSAALNQIAAAVNTIQKNASDQELQILALHTIGAVIDRVRGGIGAQATLQKFIRGGDHA